MLLGVTLTLTSSPEMSDVTENLDEPEVTVPNSVSYVVVPSWTKRKVVK